MPRVSEALSAGGDYAGVYFDYHATSKSSKAPPKASAWAPESASSPANAPAKPIATTSAPPKSETQDKAVLFQCFVDLNVALQNVRSALREKYSYTLFSIEAREATTRDQRADPQQGDEQACIVGLVPEKGSRIFYPDKY